MYSHKCKVSYDIRENFLPEALKIGKIPVLRRSRCRLELPYFSAQCLYNDNDQLISVDIALKRGLLAIRM